MSSLESRKREMAHCREMQRALRQINPEYARMLERMAPLIRIEVAQRNLFAAQTEYEDAVEALRRFDEEWSGAGEGDS